MKDWIIKKLVGLQAPKFIRHGLALLGTYLAAQGVDADVNNLADLITGSAMVLLSVAWSWGTKTPVGAGYLPALRALGEALARQAITVMAGWLAVDPTAIESGTLQTSAVAMLVLNYFLSASQAPDGSTGKGKPPLKIPGK